MKLIILARFFFRPKSRLGTGWPAIITTLSVGYLAVVPLAQLLTLRAIQDTAIADILWWPGMKA